MAEQEEARNFTDAMSVSSTTRYDLHPAAGWLGFYLAWPDMAWHA